MPTTYRNITEILPRVWHIELPYDSMQTVNVTLIKDKVLTLIDSGPAFEHSRKALFDALGELNVKWSDVELLILTHPHVDHLGGLAFLSKSPKVLAYKGTMEWLVNYNSFIEMYLQFPAKFSQLYPSMKEIFLSTEAMRWLNSYFVKGGEVIIDKEVSEGEVIDLGVYQLRVIHTPGHSMHHMVLYFEKEKVLLSGDYVLLHGPALTRMGGDSVQHFLSSIKKVQDLDLKMIIPAHGTPFEPDQGIRHLEHYVDRQRQKILDLLSEGAKNALQLFQGYHGHHVPLERAPIFMGFLDTFIQDLLTEKRIIQQDDRYFLT